MKAQGILMNGLGPFLTRMLSVRGSDPDKEILRHTASDASKKQSAADDSDARRSDAPTEPAVVIGGAEDAAKAQSGQRVMVTPGPMLVLLAMLRGRRPRNHRIHGRELSLPPGCVLAARYASR
jgi:hypothetical protein